MTKTELATALVNKWHPDWYEYVKKDEIEQLAKHTQKETLQLWYDKEFKEDR